MNKIKLDNDEIQDKADFFLRGRLTQVFQSKNYKIYIRDQNTQKDIGIDFEIEVKNRDTNEVLIIIKVQNKGTEIPNSKFRYLKSKGLAGLRSWQTDIFHVNYYRNEINVPTFFFVCDLVEGKAYWLSIQLDERVEQTINNYIKSSKRGTENIQIYFDSKNEFNSENFDRFWDEIFESQERISKRFIKFPDNDALVNESFTFKEQGLAIKESILSVVQLFTVVKTIPANTIVKLYPFSLTQRMPSTYDNFCLRTNNENLYNFFLQLKSSNLNNLVFISDYEKGKILQFLIDNQIFWIGFKSKLIEITKLIDKVNYQSFKSEFYKMKLNVAYEKLMNLNSGNCEDTLTKAYGNFIFGNIHEAILLNKTISTVKEKDSEAYQVLAKYNLKQLERLGLIYFNDTKEIESLTGINQINLQQEITLSNNIQNYLKIILTEIVSNNYLNILFDRIDTLYLKIDENNYNLRLGGFSYNNIPNELTNDLVMLIEFLENNNLIFKHLRPFANSINKAIAGLFRLYSIRNPNYSKLEALNTFHFTICVQYCKPKLLKRLIKENRIKTVQIRNSDDLAWNSLSIIENAFMEINLNFLDKLENKNLFIKDYQDCVNNIVLFFSLIEMEQSDFDQLFTKFANFIKYSSVFLPIQKRQLVLDFFNFKNKILSPEQILDLLLIPVEVDNFDDMAIVQAACVVLHEEYPGFIYNDNLMIDKVISKSLASKELNILTFFYLILDNENKNRIVKIVSDQLNQEFDSYLFKLCSHFDVIPFSQTYMDKLWELSYPDKSMLNAGNFFGLNGEYIHELNEFLDLAFKYNYYLSPKSKEVIENLNEYYFWLMNMESFDYSKFKLIWLTYHASKNFLLKIRNVPQVKDILVKNVLSENNETLIKIYFDYFAS